MEKRNTFGRKDQSLSSGSIEEGDALMGGGKRIQEGVENLRLPHVRGLKPSSAQVSRGILRQKAWFHLRILSVSILSFPIIYSSCSLLPPLPRESTLQRKQLFP